MFKKYVLWWLYTMCYVSQVYIFDLIKQLSVNLDFIFYTVLNTDAKNACFYLIIKILLSCITN